MSNLAGNPHYEDYQLDLANAQDYDCATLQLHATMALVYEQRTANLIALMPLCVEQARLEDVVMQVMPRLGLKP